jgi:tRNA-splicing ligase RtcB (3'-phosphate/5'-hydroxy nucleic acid ligase)
MEQLSKRLMNWASILEEKTRAQAERTAQMPFIFPHVALMPDAHLGLGATVGSVIPTLRAIIPAAVGVDIGCFRGDTRIPLLDGSQKSLKDMTEAGGLWRVYSLDRAGQVVPGIAVALKTRDDAELVRIVVAGGEEIICTPDHQFMLSDGTYREARDLRFHDGLMSLSRRQQTRDGYESVSTGIAAYTRGRPEHFKAAVAGSGRRGAALRWHESREHGHNRKVISVEHITERSDVYCLQVEDHHNFALAAGVFVHNCGMIAVRTQFTAAQIAANGALAPLRQAIERAIPLSAGKYNRGLHDAGTQQRVAELEALDGADSADQIAGNWRLQLGSLGSGNHFVELCLDEDDIAWTFLHSGSRGVGNKLANKHIKIARALCDKWWIPLPDADLAYLPEQTAEFWAYIRDLRWAQHFALLNRAEMMARVIGCLEEWMGVPVEASETVNCHHNYTVQEEHFGQRVWLSRKGAIDASAGRPGLIPGSMGTRSYVVTGKGNPLALNSAPHGAGRVFSRSAARKTFSRADLDAAMAGIEWRHTDAFLDEIPAAYKDVDQVMADAADLVGVRHTLRQIVNVKGD